MSLSRKERRQFDVIAQSLAQDRDFAARTAVGRPMQRRFLSVLFFVGVVLVLGGVVVAQLTAGGIVMSFYGLLAVAGSVLGHRRMVAGAS